MYEAVLFDMDGVIIDTHKSVTRFWLKLAAEHGVTLTDDDFHREIYGVPAVHTFNIFFPFLTEVQRQQVLDDLTAYEAELDYVEIRGVKQLLRDLRAAGIPSALVTSANNEKVAGVFKSLHLEGLFSTTVTVNDIKRGKPFPDCYLLGAQRLGKAAERCIVFEDSVNGARAGVASGACCIGIRPTRHEALLDIGVRHVIPDFTAAHLQQDGDGLRLVFDADYSLRLTRDIQ